MPSKYTALAKFLAKDADVVAFDAAMDAEKEAAEDAAREEAEDKACDNYGRSDDEWKEMSAKDKKRARDEFKKAKDAEEETPPNVGKKEAAGGAKPVKGEDAKVTKADLARILAEDRASQRSTILAAVNALTEAREIVKPLVGVVTFDSAEDVYSFALKQANIDASGWPLSAMKANIEALKAARTAPVAKPKLANDAASGNASALSIFPGLSRFAA